MRIEPNSDRWLDLKDLPDEEWKDIKDFESLYQISNYGRVKSFHNNIGRGIIIRKVRLNKQGYYYCNLCKNNKVITKKIHRLVAENFLKNTKNYICVNHIDGDKRNNSVYNLEWCTQSYNSNHAYKLGLREPWNKGLLGNVNKTTVEVYQYDIDGNFIKSWNCIKDVERILGIQSCNITRACQHKRHTAGGFVWKYVKDGDK